MLASWCVFSVGSNTSMMILECWLDNEQFCGILIFFIGPT